ncbi:RsmB/NOP family class I SAM-dependent RNA methyltransferase [Ligilactobacillus sp. Marseille-Q7487]|uniref:RsmB/NOP family class I SAM-dependent RNA methyltransferase n=1 Tax=Ligilactobacillus sp. Marseille-Q7487 TaxID=3022128 RepID=UPI0024A92E24|nr:RsmB/NOP family class I SAM-dependent RNA methyltransferase [Ligilactobacillus sp. Marseille-Q7487]
MQLPSEFINKYQNLLGTAEAEEFLASFTGKVQKGFRLNPLKEDFTNVRYSLKEPVEYVKTGYYGEVSGRSLEHQAGYVYSQDLSAMYVAEITDALPGQTVLDLCAAPGGKSTHLAGMMANQGLLVSNEINRKRAAILAENIERTGAWNTIVLNEDPASLAKQFIEFFDKIVVDAPCSGEGMFRKDPDAIGYWTPDYPAKCAKRQREILSEAMKMLKPGGQLVYSTCTFAPEEDEQIVSWLIATYPYLKIVELPRYQGMDAGRPEFSDGNPNLAGTIRLMPHHFRGEGHFIAKLQDTRVLDLAPVKKKKRNKKGTNNNQLNAEQFKLWQDFAQANLLNCNFVKKDLKCYGDYLYLYPDNLPDLSSLKFMRPGLLLGVFKKKRFEPSYTFALALSTKHAKNVLEVSLEQWQSYVEGNPLILNESLKNGWYLLICEHKPFSFGKVVGNNVKNFFPKALRFKQ